MRTCTISSPNDTRAPPPSLPATSTSRSGTKPSPPTDSWPVPRSIDCATTPTVSLSTETRSGHRGSYLPRRSSGLQSQPRTTILETSMTLSKLSRCWPDYAESELACLCREVTAGALVGIHVAEGNAAVIVDGHEQELPACAPHCVAAVARDPEAGPSGHSPFGTLQLVVQLVPSIVTFKPHVSLQSPPPLDRSTFGAIQR